MSVNLQPLPDHIVPRWWTGEPAVAPGTFTIDCSGYRMDDALLSPGSELDERMNRTSTPLKNSLCRTVVPPEEVGCSAKR